MKRIIFALDSNDLETASHWIDVLKDEISTFKLGLEFFMKNGAAGVRELQKRHDFDLFLDLKLHDIPNTVAGAVKSIEDLQPKFLTVHASGGCKMINAAAQVNEQINITGVTILTSLDETDLKEIGYKNEPLTSAVQLSTISKEAGAKAIVSSALEVGAIRTALGKEITLITPGVRPAFSINANKSDDQKRVMTAAQAISEGADYVVIGRPISEKFLLSDSDALNAAIQINGEMN